MTGEELRVGQQFSTSHNACTIRFVGGPWDGQEGLFDHERYDAIYAGGCKYERSAPQEYTMTERRSGDDRRSDDDRRSRR